MKALVALMIYLRAVNNLAVYGFCFITSSYHINKKLSCTLVLSVKSFFAVTLPVAYILESFCQSGIKRKR